MESVHHRERFNRTIPWLSMISIDSTIQRVFFSATLFFGSFASASPLHLLFWQDRDIREGRDITFEAHPFSAENSKTLLPGDPNRPSLWQVATDVIPHGEEHWVYYQRVEKDLENYTDQRTWCLGILKPNGEFLLPDLGLYSQSWEGPRNVVLQRSPHPPTWGGFNVFQTVGDEEHGFQVLYWDQPEEGEAGAMIATSNDGIHWRKEGLKTVFTEHNDAYSLFQNHETGEFLLYQTRLADWPDKPFVDNIPGKRRELSLRRSKDLRTWTDQAPILEPDGQDAPATEFYLFKVFPYVDRYAGILMKYYGDPNTPKKHSAITRHELLVSQDGEYWERPYRRTAIGAWSYAAPFTMDDQLCLVGYSEGGIVLYRERKDGLASCGSSGAGSFWTQPFVLDQEELFLNADCKDGEIGVEVLDGNGQPIEGFGADKCKFNQEDDARLPLVWEDRSLSELAGRKIHLRFHLNNARVYSLYGD